MKPLLKLFHTRKASVPKPIWMMRQAGRSLPEYLKVRKQFKSFMDFCLTPEAASEVTLQPIKRFGFDAAIIFADILVVPKALGMEVEFIENIGPKLTPVQTMADLTTISNANTRPVFEKVAAALKLARVSLDLNFPETALIGFAGSPWTVASYVTAGGGSKSFEETFRAVYREQDFFDHLIATITTATTEYLKMQIEAGAEVIKLFDSWSGLVPDSLYHKYIIEPTREIVSALKQAYPAIPIIGFPKGSGHKYSTYVQSTGIDGIAIDKQLSLEFAAKNFSGLVLQGNFDNMLLAYGSAEQIANEVNRTNEMTQSVPHVFNLGHGVLPQTPIKNIEALIEAVRKNEG